MNNRRTLIALIGLTAGMFAFSFALVPLYDLFCEITGLNGKVTGPATEQSRPMVSDRMLTVRFITENGNGIPWDFAAREQTLQVQIGKPQTAYFRVRNRTDQPMAGRAIPSVSPGLASKWLRKTECFCFQQQTLEPGESADLAMNFYFTDELPERYQDVVIGYTLYQQPREN